MAAPQGLEPRYADPESAVLPLNEGAVSANGAADEPHSDFIGLRVRGQFRRKVGTGAPLRKGPPRRQRNTTKQIEQQRHFLRKTIPMGSFSVPRSLSEFND